MERIAILGSGDLGQLIGYHLIAQGECNVVGFYDDFQTVSAIVGTSKILGPISQISSDFENGVFEKLIMGIGYKHLEFRKTLFEKLYKSIPFAKFVHPSTIIQNDTNIGDGSVILPGCVFDKGVKIGKNVLINVGCIIAHDSIIDSHTFIGPSVNVAGFVRIGAKCFIGIGSTIIDNIQIVDSVQLGGGSLVTKSIEINGLYYGSPCNFIK